MQPTKQPINPQHYYTNDYQKIFNTDSEFSSSNSSLLESRRALFENEYQLKSQSKVRQQQIIIYSTYPAGDISRQLSQTIERKDFIKFGFDGEHSLNDQTLLNLLQQDKIQVGMHQIESLFNRLKCTTTMNEDELRDELRDYVYDLPEKNNYNINPVSPNPTQETSNKQEQFKNQQMIQNYSNSDKQSLNNQNIDKNYNFQNWNTINQKVDQQQKEQKTQDNIVNITQNRPETQNNTYNNNSTSSLTHSNKFVTETITTPLQMKLPISNYQPQPQIQIPRPQNSYNYLEEQSFQQGINKSVSVEQPLNYYENKSLNPNLITDLQNKIDKKNELNNQFNQAVDNRNKQIYEEKHSDQPLMLHSYQINKPLSSDYQNKVFENTEINQYPNKYTSNNHRQIFSLQNPEYKYPSDQQSLTNFNLEPKILGSWKGQNIGDKEISIKNIKKDIPNQYYQNSSDYQQNVQQNQKHNQQPQFQSEQQIQQEKPKSQGNVYNGLNKKIFHSKKSSTQFQPSRTTNTVWKSKQTGNELDILCMNCDEMIPLSRVDKHSRQCLHARNAVVQLQQDAIAELNRKLETIQKGLYKHAQHAPILQSIVRDVINENNSTPIEDSVRLLQTQLKRNHPTYTLLLINRAILLSEEKIIKMQYIDGIEDNSNDQINSSLYSQLSIVEKMAQQEQANLELWKQQHDLVKQVQLQDLANLRYLKDQYVKDHEILSQFRSEYEPMSQLSDFNYQANLDQPYIGNAQPTENTIIEGSPQEKKRQFYNIAVQMKLNLPPNHPSKNILIHDIYESAVDQNIPEASWGRFIGQKMSNM